MKTLPPQSRRNSPRPHVPFPSTGTVKHGSPKPEGARRLLNNFISLAPRSPDRTCYGRGKAVPSSYGGPNRSRYGHPSLHEQTRDALVKRLWGAEDKVARLVGFSPWRREGE